MRGEQPLAPVGISGGVRDTHLVTCEHYSKNHPLHPLAQQERVPRWFRATIDHPARVLLFDILIHEDVWPGAEPELMIYDTAIRGEVVPRDPARESDRLELLESIEGFAAPASAPRCAEVPRYGEMIDRVCEDRGWKTAEFRGFRMQCQYPLYGSQYCMLFSPR